MSHKEFKSFIKLPGGGEIKRCYYPFKLDTYGCGCCNNCLYCYAKSVLDFRGLWDSEEPAVANFKDIEKVLENEFVKHKKSKYSELLQNRVPLRLGGMTDCFSKIEKTEKNTLKLLKMLKEYQYPYLILTKNDLLATDEYLSALDKDLAYVQYTITTPYDDISKVFEPGAESTSERLAAVRKLADNGFYVAVRINPLFPIYRDGYYSGEIIKYDNERQLRYFDWSLIDMIGASGAKTVIAGFLRLSSWNIKSIKEKTGEDLTWLFDMGTKYQNQALHFSTEEKRYYYEKIKQMCDSLHMDFSVCYDGDEEYDKFNYLWANKDDCCNGIGKIKGFTSNFNFLSEHFGEEKEKSEK